MASRCFIGHGKGARRSSKGFGEVGHGGSGSTAVVGFNKVAMAMIRAKGGSFPSIGVVGRLIGLPAVTEGHGRVRTAARCAVELR